MLNTDIKKQINTARDILVGKIPDPKGQIDQITNALIYKFMDDQDRLAETLPGGKASFFVNGLAPYAWHKLFDSKLSNQDRANLYIEGIEKLSKAKHLPELFQDIFKDAFLPFRASDTIAMFLNEINKFDYHHSEDLGNAFEYLLSIMGSQGDAGQFRTPRNIIEFIVDAVDPQKDETILDPACGTAGFLVEAYKHITEKEGLSQSDIQKLGKNITGIDIDPGMAKIARVNLYLHGFKTPQITEDDSLTNEKTWGKKYDVILANPPFMTPKGGIKPHDKFTIQSKRAEVLFTDYIAEHLKLAGRAGIVVPEGIIFQGSNAYKQLRKMLVDDGYLWGVISLPAGVFNPYAGVKTSVLLLDRQRASEADEIMFYKVDNDGFDLGAQRRPIKENDLPEALEIINAWRDGKKLEKEKALFVPKEKLAEDGDYNLSIDRYRVTADYTNTQWPMVELQELVSITTGRKDVNSGNPEGKYPFFTCAKEHTYSDEFSFDDEALLIAGNGAVGDVKYYNGKFEAYQRTYVLTEFENVLPRFLYNILKTELPIYLDKLKQGNTMPYIKVGMLKEYKIPLPPLEVQEQIVAELDGYQAIIDGAQKVVDNWKPKIEIDPEWERIKIGDVANLMTGGTPKTSNKSYYGGEIKWLVSGDIHKQEIFDCEGRITNLALQESNAKILPVNSVLIALNGQGKTRGTVAILRTKAACNQSLVSINPDQERLLSEFLLYSLQEKYSEIRSINGDKQRGGLNMPLIRKIELAIPSLSEQKIIIEEIKKEKELVESTKQLIKIHEDKIKKVVDGLWGE